MSDKSYHLIQITFKNKTQPLETIDKYIANTIVWCAMLKSELDSVS